MTSQILLSHIVREIYDYQALNGGRSPALIKLPKAIVDVLVEEMKTMRLYRDDTLPLDEMKICGVKVEADPAMRIAFMIDEEKTFSLPPARK